MNVRDICIVARYEALVVSRGIVFRILVLLALLGITYIQVRLQGDGMAYNWTMVATSSSMPFVNAYLFNILQAFVLIFIVTDCGVRENRGGFLECIHARPVSNPDYLIGKALGIAGVFSCLNLLSGLICLIINLVASEALSDPLIYLFYFLTLTTPSLFFFTGLCFFVTLVLRYRILAQGLLLLVLYFTVVRLSGIAHDSFDFTGSTLPNLFSKITGHPGMGDYLLQRFSFLLLGAGLLLSSVSLLRRIPNSLRGVMSVRRWGYIVLVSGVLVGGLRLYSYKHRDTMREAFRASFDRHWNPETCRVRSHTIRYHQERDRLSSVSDMVLYNPDTVSLSHVILFLNPGLKVSGVQEGGRDLKFRRDHQVLLIERELAGKDSLRLQIDYSGKIDERYCYLAVSDNRYYAPRREDNFFNFGDRHVFVGDEFTWLVPECGWYPVAIPDRPRVLSEPGRDYTFYRLELEKPKHGVALSQGKAWKRNDTLIFTTPCPLEGISLCIGDYVKKRVQTSAFSVEFYSFRKDNVLPSFFRKLRQKDVREVLEEKIGQAFELTGAYSFPSFADSIVDVCARKDWCYDRDSRLIVAELPLSLTSFYDEEKRHSAWTQPGMLFYPEHGSRGFMLNAPRQLKRWELKPGSFYEGDERGSEKGVLSTLVSSLLSRLPWEKKENPFLHRILGMHQKEDRVLVENLVSGFSLIYEPGTYITSDSYSCLDAVCKEWLWDSYKIREGGGGLQSILGDPLILEAKKLSRDCSLKKIMNNQDVDPNIKNTIWQLKCEELFDLLCFNVSRDRVWDFLKGFYWRYEGEVAGSVFRQELLDSCGVDIGEFYEDWFSSSPQNVYQVKDEKIVKVHGTGQDRLLGEFKIRHCGNTKGYISILSDNPFAWEQDCRVYRLEPGECYQFRFPIGMGRFSVNTNISRNMPGEIFVESVVGADDEYIYEWGRDTCCGMFKISPSSFEAGNEDCIIVDNESPDFRLVGPPRKWLQRLLGKNAQLYTDVILFNQVVDSWGKAYAGRYHGDSIRSAYGKPVEKGAFKAEWSADIKNAGKYEVFALIHDSYWSYQEGKKKRLEYHYTLEYGDESRDVILPLLAGQKGWESLGKFDFLPGKVKITLDDRGLPEQIVCADAVKLCKVVE